MKKKGEATGLLGTTIRIFISITIVGVGLFAYIEKQNELIELRLAIPVLSKELKEIQERNTELKYEIACFESPIAMMEIARRPEYSHLKYPSLNQEIILKKGWCQE